MDRINFFFFYIVVANEFYRNKYFIKILIIIISIGCMFKERYTGFDEISSIFQCSATFIRSTWTLHPNPQIHNKSRTTNRDRIPHNHSTFVRTFAQNVDDNYFYRCEWKK